MLLALLAVHISIISTTLLPLIGAEAPLHLPAVADASFAKQLRSRQSRSNSTNNATAATTSPPPTVSSGDGLSFMFGSGGSSSGLPAASISGVSVDGVSISPATTLHQHTGFEIADYMQTPLLPTGLGPELLLNGNFSEEAAATGGTGNTHPAANWTNDGAPGLTRPLTRVHNVSRTPGGYSLMAVAAAAPPVLIDGQGAGAYQTVTDFGGSSHSPLLLLSGWSKAVGVSGEVDTSFAVYADLEFMDGSHLYGQCASFNVGTHGWERATRVISLEKPVQRASVYVLLRGQHTGTAYFSDISLVRAKALPEPIMLNEGTAVLQPDGTVVVQASAPAPISLAVAATFEGHQACIRVRGRITRTDHGSGDRAISVGLVVPVDAAGWHFPSGLDTHKLLGPTDNAIGVQYQNPALPHPTDYYPFLTLVSNKSGIAAGVDVDGPVFVSRASYTAARNGLRITADFALTAKSDVWPDSANFSFVFFRVGSTRVSPSWGFRAALQKYYSLFPVFSKSVITDQGNWLVAVSNISAVENHSDFGFKFDEGGGSANECRVLNEAQIGVFPYIEPHLVHWSLPRNSTIDYQHIMASLRACAASVNECMPGATQPSQRAEAQAKALSVLSTGVMDASGHYRWRPEDAEWNYGCVFWVDLDPQSHSDPHSAVAKQIRKVEAMYTMAQQNNYTLRGIYVDSVANAQDLLNFDPVRLRTARYPPVFDKQGRPAVLMLQNTLAFLLHLSENVLKKHKGLLMGNGPYYPQTQYRMAPVFAVSGGETFWYNSNNKIAPFTPTSHELMALHRVMAYQRPYMPLQDSDFLDWTYDMTDQYHQIELALGMWPGFFSHDAASRPYFRNASWYNRDRPLFRRYVPVLQEINQAGWQPVTGAIVDTAFPPAFSRVWVERFGPSASSSSPTAVYFTVRNEGRSDLASSMTLTLDGSVLSGLERGQHSVSELTRGAGKVVIVSTVPKTDGTGLSLPIVLDDATGLGGVAVNMTVTLKIDLKAQSLQDGQTA
jgi:hypothetical protein